MNDTTSTAILSLTCPRVELFDAVSAVLEHAGRGAFGLFRASESGLTITASQVNRGARYQLPTATITTPGVVVIPLEPLVSALHYSPGQSVTITLARSQVLVAIDPDSSEPRQFEFPLRDTQSIPLPPALEPLDTLTLPAADFKHLVHHVAFAAERRERDTAAAGWATIGGLATLERKHLTLAATDTYRLALSGLKLARTRKPAKLAQYLLPVRAWKYFADSCRSHTDVTLHFTSSQVILEAGPLTAWASLMHGTFPPTAAAKLALPHAFTLPTLRFLADVEAALAFTDPDDPAVVLATAPGLVTLSPESGDRGSCELVTRVPGFPGPRVTVALHGPRLAGLLSAYSDFESVTVRWVSSEKPLLFEAGSSRCLVIPRILRDDHPAT